MRYKICFCIFALLAVSTLSYADEKAVKVAAIEDYAPFCMTEENLKSYQIIQVGHDAVGFKGYSWDVLRESFHEMGYTIHLVIIPWERGMMLVKTGLADILFPTGKNTERQKIFYYSEEPVNRDKYVVYVRADNPIEWKGFESLKGQTVGVNRGWNFGDKWKATTGVNTYGVSTIFDGFKMLNANRFDGLLGYEISWDYVLKQKKWKTKFRKLPAFGYSSEHLVALKTNPNGEEILKAFDTGKKRLIESGKLKEIKYKWFGN